jgi:hypothetical protein
LPSKEDLWKAQLAAYPDSVKLTPMDIRTIASNYVSDYYDKDLKNVSKLSPEVRRAAIDNILEHTKREQDGIKNCLIYCLLQHPDGILYACGKKSNGVYANMGMRIGTEPSEYYSGFQVTHVNVPSAVEKPCSCGDTTPQSEWEAGYDGWPRCPNCGMC